jgi:tRNA(Ile)-lysidine synthase
MLNGKGKLLVAVSGGVDSIVLTDLLFRSDIDFVIAHCNFQLRNEESERDEAFVKQLEQRYSKQVYIKRFDTNVFTESNKLSIQEAARKLRYDWFQELIKENSLSFVATAHHANDNAETVLMHLFRGTGLKGLTGIPSFQNNIIRPLLPFTKEQLQRYAQENRLSFVEDSSNSSNKYTRNFFRNELIPSVEKIFPNTQQNIKSTIERLKETQIIFDEAVELKRKKLFKQIEKSSDESIPVLEIKKLHPSQTWIWELFKGNGISATQTDELIKLLDADTGSYLQTGTGYRIIKNRNRLLITNDLHHKEATAITIDKGEKKIIFPKGELNLEEQSASGFKIPSVPAVCCIDTKHIQFPLLLRKWKQGDYFYPLGMNKKKKLSKFFIDQKLSLLEKENVWVLESNKRIVWIVNHRMDDRFKIKPSTEKILKIEFRML